ncbi:MAG: M15 family metallopeptidase [Eubacterium sp.]|nr:M15 family metallopeptidase [Eubacterium sp.]
MSQNASSDKTPANWKELLRIAAKPTVFLLFLIMVCASLAHYLTGSETLEEYARNNPEQAYGTESDISPSDDTNTIPEPNTETNTDLLEYNGLKEPASNTEIPNKVSSDAEKPEEALDIGNPKPPTSDTETSEKENNDMADSQDRTTYQPGFYYEPLSEDIKQRITGISYPETGCTVPYEDLNYVGLTYIDFNGEEQKGELICNKAIAQDMVEIFYELFRNGYQLERVRLIDEYDGDDTLSMMDNNTSCFNYRVVDGTDSLSKHALGCAIDINPFYNPYVVFNRGANGETYISPKGSEIYADRSQDFPYKIDENDLCYRLFTEHGFTWGGNWNSCKDYQHFQIVLP